MKTLLVDGIQGGIEVTLNRPEYRNSINQELLQELAWVLQRAEQEPAIKLIVLQGMNGIFCTGMDFREQASPELFSLYMNIIKTLSLTPKITVAKVDGQATAGGLGLLAACDLVVATPRSQFSLSEALWGALPSMVLPYLIRRIGYQRAYALTLTTQVITAQEAREMQLVDEVGEDLSQIIQRLTSRTMYVNESTLREMKQYFRRMWLINEQLEKLAVETTARLMNDPLFQQNVRHFLESGKYPWQK